MRTTTEQLGLQALPKCVIPTVLFTHEGISILLNYERFPCPEGYLVSYYGPLVYIRFAPHVRSSVLSFTLRILADCVSASTHLLACNTAARPHRHISNLKPDVAIKPRAPTDLRGGRVRAKSLVPVADRYKLADPDRPRQTTYSDSTTSDGFELYDWAWSRDGVHSHPDTQATPGSASVDESKEKALMVSKGYGG